MKAGTSAGKLIRRARGVTVRHVVFRAMCRGTAAGALTATIIAASARLSGTAPGAWLSLAVLPAIVVMALGLRRAGTSLPRAAALLDRAGGTKERFLATLTAADPEVRDLAAAQAMASPRISGGEFPLRFPPTTEGLAAAVSVALLVGVLLLSGAPDSTPGNGAPGRAISALPGQPANTPDTPGAPGVPTDPGTALPSEVEQITRRMAAGEEMAEEDWRTLERAGLAKKVRGEVAAALDSGEPGRAAEAVRRALRESRSGNPVNPANPPLSAGWDAYRQALDAPIWSPRYDAVVRRYFTGAGEAGLR